MDFDERTYFPLKNAPGKLDILINATDIGERRTELVKNITEGQDVAITVINQREFTLPHHKLFVQIRRYTFFVCKKHQL